MGKSFKELWSDFNQNGFEFLMTDLEAALAFTTRAESSLDPETKQRNTAHARKAYVTIIRLREKFQLDSEQRRAVDGRQSQLKNALEQLGEEFLA